MLGHGGDRRLRRRDRHARARAAPARASARTRAAASASRAASACTRALELVEADSAGRPRAARGAARDARGREPLRPRQRHARADPQPPPALARRSSAVADTASPSTASRSRSRRARRCSTRRAPPAAGCRRSASTTGSRRSAPAASASSASTARADRSPRARRLRATACGVDTEDALARRIAANVVELVLSELPAAARAAHRARARSPRASASAPPRWRGAVPRAAARRPATRTSSLRHELCISCGRCVRACDEVQGAFALTATGRGFDANIAAGLDAGFADSTCVSCGACADTCPTGAISERAAAWVAAGASNQVSDG